MVGTNQLFIVIEGHKESAPAVHIPKLRRPYHSYPYNEICTNGYAHTGVSSPFAIHCTLSIVIGRDLRALESLSNQIQYLIEPTMSKRNSAVRLLCRCKDTKNLGELCNLRNNCKENTHFCHLGCMNQLF